MNSINDSPVSEKQSFWPYSENYYILLFTLAFLAVVACFTVLLTFVGETEVEPTLTSEIFGWIVQNQFYIAICASLFILVLVLGLAHFKIIKIPYLKI